MTPTKRRQEADYSEAEARYSEQLKDPNVRVIRLTKGQVTIVDASDYARLSKWNWYVNWSPGKNGYYASRCVGKRRTFMQGEIMGLHGRRPPTKKHKRVVDHKNGDPCDNRYCNLQIIRRSKDALKRKTPKSNTTRCRCITRRKRAHGYVYEAYINIRGKRVLLGALKTKELAVAARVKAVRRTRDPNQREHSLNSGVLVMTAASVIWGAIGLLAELRTVLHQIK